MLRPFTLSAQVSHRGYSLPLQRRVTDFGADIAFGQVNKKLREHYNIELPTSSIRKITMTHAQKIKQIQNEQLGQGTNKATHCVISETDGSMIPIVKIAEVDDQVVDRRKQKTVFYREARLTLAHEAGSKALVFSGTLGDVKETGTHISHCVKKVGADQKTKVHCVGDGAAWIANQVEEHFGSMGTYLIDFYHLCEYLSPAAKVCAPNDESGWLEEQKKQLKESQAFKVLLALQPYLEPNDVGDEEAVVRACYRYIKNRLHQLDYKAAIEDGLPIGSGEIESAHRYVIQARIKIQGAWWLEDTAGKILALRINRINGEWNEYWKMAA